MGTSASGKPEALPNQQSLMPINRPQSHGVFEQLSSEGVYFTFLETNLVISNMLTCFLPPNTACSVASALIWVFTFLS